MLEGILEDKNRKNYVEDIQTTSLRDFVREALQYEEATAEKFEISNQVIFTMRKMFERMHQISDDYCPTWFEVLIVAAYVHNIFYDGSLLGIFKAREEFMPLIRKHEVPVNAASLIFQAVECQLGSNMPVESCMPNAGTPNDIFSWACWFVEELNGDKTIPDCGAF